MTGWQGNTWYEINPTFQLLQTYAPIYSDSSLVMIATAPNIGVYWAGLRVYALDPANPWGLYMSLYDTASPSASFSML
jgi:hypothetical protein